MQNISLMWNTFPGPGVTATSISEHVRPLTFQELNMKIFRQSMPIWNSISKRWTELSATPIWIRWPMSRSRGTPRRVIRPSGPEISPPVSEITTVSAAIPIRLNWQGRSNRSSSQVITISRSIYPAAPMTAIKLICVISASLELQG